MIAIEARNQPGWVAYAAFAKSRSLGRRTEAFLSLGEFVTATASWTFEARLEFCRWLLEKSQGLDDQAIALPQPLKVSTAQPTMEEWSQRNPKSAEAHLWLGLMRCGDPSEHLALALDLDPSCETARWNLANWILADVEYNQHHLPDYYIHDPRADLEALDRAQGLIDGGLAEERAALLCAEASELRSQAEAWLALHPTPGDFASR